MLRTRGALYPRHHSLAVLVVVLVMAAATVACDSEKPKSGSAPSTAAPAGTPETAHEPEIVSLAPSDSPGPDVDRLVLSWKPMADIDRFVLCETVPPHGTECEDLLDLSESTVTVPGPTKDGPSSGTWLKYLWLQSCGERECSRPPTAAGAIAHRVAYGSDAWNFVVIVRKLERDQIEVTLGNASQERADTSTLIARTPGGSEIAHCEDLAPGEWCGPFEGTLLSNELVAEQIYRDVGVTVKFPIMPSTTAPQ